MKTIIKSLALALSLGVASTTTLLAETNPVNRPAVVAAYKSGIYTNVSGQLNIAVDKEKGGSVDIRLKNTEGRVLFTQHLGRQERICRLKLNLNDLADGLYQLEITNGAETTTQTITLSTNHPVSPSRLVAVN